MKKILDATPLAWGKSENYRANSLVFSFKNLSKQGRMRPFSKNSLCSIFCLDCSLGSLKTIYNIKDSCAKGLAIKPGLNSFGQGAWLY
jgi:hypothetical protein